MWRVAIVWFDFVLVRLGLTTSYKVLYETLIPCSICGEMYLKSMKISWVWQLANKQLFKVPKCQRIDRTSCYDLSYMWWCGGADTDQDQDGLLITFPSKIPSFTPDTRAGLTGCSYQSLLALAAWTQSRYLGLNDNLNWIYIRISLSLPPFLTTGCWISISVDSTERKKLHRKTYNWSGILQFGKWWN